MQSRAYIGQYSASGDFFIAAYQVRCSVAALRYAVLYSTSTCIG